jgi:hypothetical protein
MASKAKSGLTAVRGYPERIRQLSPPNTFTIGAPSFIGPVRDGQGHASVHASVTNDTGGVLTILQAWRSSGPFVQVLAIPLTADPATGFFTADVVFPVVRRFVQIIFTPTTVLGANFELGGYFEPRADSGFLSLSGGVPIGPPPVAPGGDVDTNADVAVGIGATAPLGTPPAGTTLMTIQNTGPAGSLVRIREVGGTVGTGIVLVQFGSVSYREAIQQMEAQDVSSPGVGANVAVQFESPL